MSTRIFVTLQFEGFHRWKDAPEEHAYLRDYHRHMFHVRVELPVEHSNRDTEFIAFKRKVEGWLQIFSGWDRRFEYSCEQLAEKILRQFGASVVTVSEDGENGAIVERS